jgi:Sulfotransferase domain.
MHLLQESQIEELLALEKLLDAQLPIIKAAPTKELMSCLRSWSHIAWNISRDADPYKLDQQSINEGLELIQHPVFICGVHRSGTTLMRDLLDNHPQLSVLPSEGSFFTQLNFHIQNLPKQERASYVAEEWMRRLVNPINQPPYWLLGKSSSQHSPYVEFGRIFQAWFNELEQVRPNAILNLHLSIVLAYTTLKNHSSVSTQIKYWIDKTPVIERYYNHITNNFPKAKFIHIVRHPVDIFLSRKAMEPAFNKYRFIGDLAFSFDSAIKYSQSCPDHYLVIKYEDLVENTIGCINKIVKFLGIEDTSILYKPSVAGIASYSNSSFTIHSPAGTILKNMNNKTKTLSKEENELLAAYVSRTASYFGYHLNSVHLIKKLSIKAGNLFHRIR